MGSAPCVDQHVQPEVLARCLCERNCPQPCISRMRCAVVHATPGGGGAWRGAPARGGGALDGSRVEPPIAGGARDALESGARPGGRAAWDPGEFLHRSYRIGSGARAAAPWSVGRCRYPRTGQPVRLLDLGLLTPGRGGVRLAVHGLSLVHGPLAVGRRLALVVGLRVWPQGGRQPGGCWLRLVQPRLMASAHECGVRLVSGLSRRHGARRRGWSRAGLARAGVLAMGWAATRAER